MAIQPHSSLQTFIIEPYTTLVNSYYLLFEDAVTPQGIFFTLFFGAILLYFLIRFLLALRRCFWHWHSSFIYRLTTKSLEWEDIKNIILSDINFPCKYKTSCGSSKEIPTVQNFNNFAFIFEIITSFLFALIILLIFVLFSHKLYFHIFVSKLSSPLDFTFAAFILFITVVTQVYLKTSAEQKLKWLKTLETELTNYFSFLTSERTGEFLSEKYEETTRCDPYRFERKTYYASRFKLTSKLELLLDPSKKEHRALLALMHHVIDVNQLQMDHNILQELGFLRSDRAETYNPDVDIFNHKAHKNKKGIMARYMHEYRISITPTHQSNGQQWLVVDRYEVISMIFRLAQFIMGRERYRARLIW
jgi:hypothetical protein